MKPAILGIACCFLVLQLEAQPRRGIIEGIVKDRETGEALVGANVTLRGTVMGRATQSDGSFRIVNVPVGRYVVDVSMVGYERASVMNVEVREDRPTFIAVELKPVAIETEAVVVTASRREQRLREVPATIATVTAQTIAERNSITLDDALRYVPGVNILQDQVNIRGSSGYSRGVGSRVLILFDGLPYLTGDTGEISWETIPTHQIERVEVLKGAGSALYGSSALGGVINVLTREIGDRPEVRFRLYSGAYDNPRFREWRWSSGVRLNSGAFLAYADRFGPLRMLGSVHRSVDESYRENDTYHRWTYFTKLRYELSPFQSLTIVGNFLSRTHQNFMWWKSLREATRPAESQRNTQVTSRRGNVSAAYQEFTSDRFFYTVKGMYFGNFWQDDSLGKVNYRSTSDVFQVEGQGVYQLSRGNVLTFGIAGNVDRVSSNIFRKSSAGIRAPDEKLVGFGGALYLQDEVLLAEGWRFTGGMRLDMQKVAGLASGGQLNPKLGLVYSPSKSTSLRMSYGAGFRYPAIGELYSAVSGSTTQVVVLPNPNLRPETSKTYELGISQFLGEHVFVEASLFHNDFRDLIEASVAVRNVKRSPEDTVGVDRAVIVFENVTRARIQGAETVVKVDWIKRTLLSEVGYTYIWPLDLSEQTVLKFRPRHLFYSNASFSSGPFRMSVDGRFISRIERIDENLVRLAPIIHGDERVAISVVDARLSYDLLGMGVPLRIGFNVNNVFNYHYVELIGNLAPVRTFMLVLDGIF